MPPCGGGPGKGVPHPQNVSVDFAEGLMAHSTYRLWRWQKAIKSNSPSRSRISERLKRDLEPLHELHHPNLEATAIMKFKEAHVLN